MKKCDIGLIGLAVMGENLALNMASKGLRVALWNRETEWVERFLAGRGREGDFLGCMDLRTLAASLRRPRKILMMVRAGAAVDALIEGLLPLLEPGDILIDGGNSSYVDTARRCAAVEAQGMLYVGMGVSGGGEGALKGPCLMPGGSPAAWRQVKDVLLSICARAQDGASCCAWMGEGGAGHYIKMVHNGVEYGDMQLICEAYQLMRDLLGMEAGEMAQLFRKWNETELSSYLIGITAEILDRREADGTPLVDRILDRAGQKGTGKWAVVSALEEGVPLPLIAEAVFARCLSAQKEERRAAERAYLPERPPFTGDRAAFLDDLRQALLAGRLVSYAQGFALMRCAAQTNGWKLNYAGIAQVWRGGCIIRSALLERIQHAFGRNPELENLLLDDALKASLSALLPAWRRVAAAALLHGVPAPSMTAGLSWLDGYTCARLPANLLQAQRDYFGAHGYERCDDPGIVCHSDWTGLTGEAASGSYNA